MNHIHDYKAHKVLLERHGITQTDSFQKWFSNSKVVDSEGNPLVVYHGTGDVFDTFRKDKIGTQGTTLGDGFYFTEIRDNAAYFSDYTEGKRRNVLEVYLSLQNPVIATSVIEYRKIVAEVRNTQTRGMNAYQRESILKKTNTQLLIEANYDGVIYLFNGRMAEIVAFYPNQIKSATNNNGAFDKHSDSILEMKERTRRRLDVLTNKIRQRMLVNPAGLPVAEVAQDLRGAITTGQQLKVIKVYKDDKGTTRLLLIDGDNPFCVYDAIRKFTSPALCPTPKVSTRISKDPSFSTTPFLLMRAELTRNVRKLPNCDELLYQIAQVEIGDTTGLVAIEDSIKQHDEYLQSVKDNHVDKRATAPDQSPIPTPSRYGKIKNNDNTNFMLDRADFKKVAKTLPKADYILGKIMDIELGDIKSLHELRHKVYAYYQLPFA